MPQLAYKDMTPIHLRRSVAAMGRLTPDQLADEDTLRWREYVLDEIAKWRAIETTAHARAEELIRALDNTPDDAA